jgi:drug/metabolite transporter (DMT)-like permease
MIKESSSPPLVIAAYRMVFTVLLLLVPFVRRGGIARLRGLDRSSLAWIALSGVLLALHFATWTESLQDTSVASSVLFVSVHPVLVAMTAFLVFGERASLAAIAGIALTLVGSAVVAGGDVQLGAQAARGDALAFAGAVVFAGYLLIGRGARRSMDTIEYSVPAYTVCALFLAPCALIFGQPLTAAGGRDVAIFLGLAIVPTLGGHLLYNWTLKYLETAVVSVSFLGEPVGASLLAWILLGQRPALSTAIGGAIILAGIWITVRRQEIRL